jgi:membrane protein implicated in regulation of membrane protease activity
MMEIWSFVSAWYNLPFTILILFGLILVAMQLVGLGGGEDHDSDLDHDIHLDHDVDLDHDIDLAHDIDVDHGIDLEHEVDLAHDVDLDHDIDLSHDVDLDHDIDLQHDIEIHHDIDVGHEVDYDLSHDIDHDLSHEVDHEASGSTTSSLSLLAFLGAGKIPLTVLLLILFDTIGMLGWILNGLVSGVFKSYPGIAFGLVLPLSLLGGGMITSRTARLFGRLLPPISSTATRAQALVGRRGTVISPFVDEKYGMVHLRDAGGTLISIFAVAHPSETGEPIKRGDEVLLLSYDHTTRRYLVANVKPFLPRAPGP